MKFGPESPDRIAVTFRKALGKRLTPGGVMSIILRSLIGRKGNIEDQERRWSGGGMPPLFWKQDQGMKR